jgi:hypothetical protein
MLQMSPGSSYYGSDADMYVRIGGWPSTYQYDCRPYTETSNEACTITIVSPARVYVAVAGYANGSSAYRLDLSRLGIVPPSGGYGGYGGYWEGMVQHGTASANEQLHAATPVLPQGRYYVQISGSGDADLYVGLGYTPTLNYFDCRPYRQDSNESCVVDIVNPVAIGIMIRGYAYYSEITLRAWQQ